MSFEGGSDVPRNFPEDLEYNRPAGNCFEGMGSDEIPLTPSGIPATEHRPQPYPNESEAAPLPPDGLAIEQSSEAFGLARFQNDEPYFNGRPPADYLEATTGRMEAVLSGEHSVVYRYAPFRDVAVTTRAGEEPLEQPVAELETRLEYADARGRAEITLMADSVDVRFTSTDGGESFARYYTQTHTTGATDGLALEYKVLHKDTHDPRLNLPPMAEDTPESVQRAWYAAARQVRRLQDAGADRPLASPEEAAYVFEQIISQAQPAIRTVDDLVQTLRREHAAAQAGFEPPLAVRSLYAQTYYETVNVYEAAVAEPDDVLAAQARGSHEVFGTEHAVTTIWTYPCEIGADDTPLPPEVQMQHLEDLTAATPEEKMQVVQRHGLTMPDDGDVAVVVNRLVFGHHNDHIICAVASEVRNSEGFHYPPVIHEYMATAPVLQDLRSYLLLGTDSGRLGDGPPVAWTPG